MMQMQREMAKAGVIDEMMADTMDSALDTDDMEEETEEEVEKVSSTAMHSSDSNHLGVSQAQQPSKACQGHANLWSSA